MQTAVGTKAHRWCVGSTGQGKNACGTVVSFGGVELPDMVCQGILGACHLDMTGLTLTMPHPGQKKKPITIQNRVTLTRGLRRHWPGVAQFGPIREMVTPGPQGASPNNFLVEKTMRHPQPQPATQTGLNISGTPQVGQDQRFQFTTVKQARLPPIRWERMDCPGGSDA